MARPVGIVDAVAARPRLRLALIGLRALIAAFGAVVAYACVRSLTGDPAPEPALRAALYVLAGLGLALALAQLMPRRLALLTACVLPALGAAYLYEAVLAWRADAMWQWRFTAELRRLVATVPNPAVQYSPINFSLLGAHLTLPNGDHVLPLGEVANARTLMCQEGDRPFTIFDSDSHGFNNPDAAWPDTTSQAPRIVLIGDSFAYGACVAPQDHFAASLRARVPGTVNLSQGGNGPLLELAALREYAAQLRPSYVFWFYDENNDVYSIVEDLPSDLENELKHPILKRYLDDRAFTQDLRRRQADINAALKRQSDHWIANRLRDDTPLNRVLLFLTAPQIRALLPKRLALASPWPARAMAAQSGRADPDQPDIVAVFRRILALAVAETRSFGGRFVFVSIPALTRFCFGRDYQQRDAVLAAARAEAAVVIDLEADFHEAAKADGAPALFAARPCRGHFSERGYALVARRLHEFLDLEDGKLSLPRPGWARTDDGRLVYAGGRR